MKREIEKTAVESLMEEAMLKCQFCRYQNICIELMRMNCIQSIIEEHFEEPVKTHSYEN